MVKVIVADKKSVDDAARTVAREVRLVGPEVLRGAAEDAAAALREVRAQARGKSDAEVAELIAVAFQAQGLATEALLERLEGESLSSLQSSRPPAAR